MSWFLRRVAEIERQLKRMPKWLRESMSPNRPGDVGPPRPGQPLTEGANKGGRNARPTGPRPAPPKGQGGAA